MPPQNKPTGFIMTPPPINVSEVGPSDRTDSSQDQVGISRTCQKVDRPLDSTTNISFNKDFMKKDVISNSVSPISGEADTLELSISSLPQTTSGPVETTVERANPEEDVENIIISPQSGGVDIPPSEKAVVPPAYDPFDPANLRTKPRNSGVTVKKAITTIPAKRKPGNQDFVRTRPGDDWQVVTVIVPDKNAGSFYAVVPPLHDQLEGKEGFRALLRLAITRDGTPFVWVLKLPTTGASYENWFLSALEAATLAETQWVRLESSKEGGYYEVIVATGIDVEPEWPDMEFKEILRLCFENWLIDTLEHKFLKKLRGEI